MSGKGDSNGAGLDKNGDSAGSACMIMKGDPTSCKGLFVIIPIGLTYNCGSLGNELLSYNTDARSNKEIKED